MDTVLDQRSQAKYDLAVEMLRSVGEARLPLAGSSMLPTLWPGDILAVRRQAIEEIAAGHIVVFERQGRLVAHRVLRLTRDAEHTVLFTQGDRTLEMDSPVSSKELLGRVTCVYRGDSRLIPSLSCWRRAVAWILRRSDLCTRLILRLHDRYGKPAGGEVRWAV